MNTVSIDTYLLIKPNWEDIISVKKAFRTTIVRGIRGNEKRAALLNECLIGTTYKITSLNFTEFAYLKRKIFRYLHQVIGVPIWTDLCTLQSIANSGQSILSVDNTEHKFYETGRRVAIMDPDDLESYEIGEVSTITSTSITLAENLSATWPIGTQIVPIIPCRLGDELGFSMVTDRHGNISIQAMETRE